MNGLPEAVSGALGDDGDFEHLGGGRGAFLSGAAMEENDWQKQQNEIFFYSHFSRSII
jgi:hypothetical protein